MTASPPNSPLADDRFERAKAAFFAGTEALQQGRLQEAERQFDAALELVPGRASLLINRAATRLRLGRPGDALADANSVLATAPDDVDALFQQGTALGRLDRLPEALATFERLVQRDAGHVEGRRRHAQTLEVLAQQPGLQHRLTDALASYRVLLTLQPGSAADWSACGTLLRELGRHEEAAAAFQAALDHGGDPALNGYYLAAVQGGARPPSSAPRRYVQALFDQYADEFDAHLVGQLGYHAHETLIEPLDTLAPVPRRATLDLGCGTGLCGPLLRRGTARLDGVDLSPGMLEKARALGLYDTLTEADLVDHLQTTPERYDLIVAADVFIYVGALEPVFDGIDRVLEPGGVFCFSAELDAGEGYRLLPSLRYAHSETYLVGLARRHGYSVLEMRRQPVRQDQRETVDGLYVYLRRGSTGH